MSHDLLIEDIGEWLIDEALANPDIVTMFEMLCQRLYVVGVPVARARLTWPTLHPLFQSETILWRRNAETEFEQFRHQEETSEQWKRSPMAYMFDNGVFELRRNLDGPNKLIDFDILDDLLEEGMTDYLVIATSFIGDVAHDRFSTASSDPERSGPIGLIVNWAADRPGGFTDDDLSALKRLQRRFAVACKTVVQRRISSNISECYLGPQAGRKVLEGAIKLGDGEETQAVVWYADMRRSTSLAETLPPEEFLLMLNEYFACTAGPTIEFGGEVLDFIGDAVLAIFPFDDDAGRAQAINCGVLAMEEALRRVEATNERRVSEGRLAFDLGIGINVGKLVFGNIGVEQRLSFSVIGPTINEVERIESLTKTMDTRALVSNDIAEQDPERWRSMGSCTLNGVAQSVELFAPKQLPDTRS